jgi:hypothetical protein
VSTRAINEVVDFAEKLGRVFDPDVLERARAEIEAIERAAKDLTSDEVRRALRHASEDVQMARLVLETIATDAK